MYKKVLSFILVSLCLSSMIFGSLIMQKVSATPQTRKVPDDYPKIQDAINAASPGDIIQVGNGTYNENIIVNKSVSLIGENSSNTIVDGSGTERDVIVIANAHNVRIEGFTIQNGEGLDPTSLSIASSSGHIIRNNIIRQSNYGLRFRGVNDSYITNNVITNNTVAGFCLSSLITSSSNRNKVVGNLIKENSIGILVADEASKNNTFYHNNFVDNLSQASSQNPTNFWGNGAEGNYWSDYHGQDLNGDGIGDTNDCGQQACIPHLGLDWNPLIEPWSETRRFSSMWNGVTYYSVVQCNSTVASFNFTYSLAQISFNVTGPQNAISFCNVTIDKSLLDGNFTIFVNKIQRNLVSTHNSTHTSLYFTFSHSTRRIQVKSTKVAGNHVPTADFTYSPINPKENQEIQFTDTSTDLNGSVVAWSWNLGDGNVSSFKNPVHTYMKGTYNVTLTVTDNLGVKNTITKTIDVTLPSADYTLFYIIVGIAAGALIFGGTFFLFKKKKKPFSPSKIVK